MSHPLRQSWGKWRRKVQDPRPRKEHLPRPSMSRPTITVLYFASASTATGLTTETVPIPESGQTLSELPTILTARHPKASNLKEILDSSQWSVDCEMIDEPEKLVLKGGEEVAVICPVSGG